MRKQLKLKIIPIIVASAIGSSVYAADNTSEIDRAIQLLEAKGFRVSQPSDVPVKEKASITTIAPSPNGTFDSFIAGDLGRGRYSDGYGISDDQAVRFNDNSYGLRGSFAYTTASKVGVQFDGAFRKEDMKSAKLTNTDLAGHLFYRNERFLLGGIAQYSMPKVRNNLGYGNSDESSDALFNLFIRDPSANELNKVATTDQAFFGVEGQGYFGDLTVTGQLARQEFINQKAPWSDISSDSALFKHGLVATAKADYFINDNWKVDAKYTHNKTYGDVSDSTGHNFKIGTEYLFTTQPISIYANYTHDKFDFLGQSEFKTDSVMAGIKIGFGGPSTLKARSQSGASLDPIDSSVNMARAWARLANESFFTQGFNTVP